MYGKGSAISRDEQRRVLDAVLARARAGAPSAITVFDLDSTLFDNRPRQARILREFGESRGFALLTRSQPEHWTSWDIADAIRAAGVPAEEAAAIAPEAKAFWRERFFTSPYCADDRPLPGARDFLVAIRLAGAQVAYVTGRHAEMGPGSVESFRTAGFPLPDERAVHLLLKPTFEMTDDAWKEIAYARLDAIGRVVAAFDNEPTHINGYAGRFPSAITVHLATDDSGRPVPLAPGVPSIADFVR